LEKQSLFQQGVPFVQSEQQVLRPTTGLPVATTNDSWELLSLFHGSLLLAAWTVVVEVVMMVRCRAYDLEEMGVVLLARELTNCNLQF